LTEFLTDLRNLCGIISPEIEQPIYVVNHPADLPRPAFVDAYTFTRTVSIPLRDRLIASGAWRGPGPVLVLNGLTRHPGAAAGMVLHELAHHLPFVPIADESCDEARPIHLRQFKNWAAATSPPAGLPWLNHEAQFIRACLHIYFRAIWHRWAIGSDFALLLNLDLGDLRFAGADYQLSAPHDYKNALGDEPGRTIDQPLTDVLKTQAPPAFTDLFHADVEAWHRYQIEREIAAA